MDMDMDMDMDMCCVGSGSRVCVLSEVEILRCTSRNSFFSVVYYK